MSRPGTPHQQSEPGHASLLRTLRVSAYDALLVGIGVFLWFTVARQASPIATNAPGASGRTIPWFVLAVLFCSAEIWVVHVHVSNESQRFSLVEIPVVISLFYATPQAVATGQLVGTAIALAVYHRQRGTKLAFNLAQFLVATLFAFGAIHLLTGDLPQPFPLELTAILSAMGAATIFGAISVNGVIALSGGTVNLAKFARVIALALAQTGANACIGFVSVLLYQSEPVSVVLLVVPLGVTLLAYRGYTTERQRHERLLFLYDSNRIWQAALDLDTAVSTLLRRACDMFRAERAEIILFAQGDEPARRASLHDGGVEALHTIAAGEIHQLAEQVSLDGGALALNDDRSPGYEHLAALGLRDALAASLHAEAGALGTIIIGNRRRDVGPFDDDDVKLFATFADHAAIALENTRLDRELKHQAFHDSLTQLANLALFTNRVEHALRRRPGPDQNLAVLFLDLDDFKVVNDTLGHAVGDELLRAAAQRLITCIRAFDTAARVGGDEFAVLLEDVEGGEDATMVAQRIIDAFNQPFDVEGNHLVVRTSIGVVVSSAGAGSAGDLLARADVAMYRAKEQGKGGFSVFEPSMQAAVLARHELRGDLEQALPRGELVMFYQPIIDIAKHTICGVEALIRWQHPVRGFMPPMSFIPLAEETGLIVPIGAWVLQESCRQVRDWQLRLPACRDFCVNVNVSSRQLQSPTLLEDVQNALLTSGLPATSLVVEITESVLLQDVEAAIETLKQLRSLGMRVSIDDFGTGYSSLGYLRRLPIDQVKVDRSFVMGIAEGTEDRSMTLAIVRLLDTIDVETVAEGIETEAQLDYIAAMGFDHGQGFLFSRPLSPAALEPLLQAGLPQPATMGQ